jgi:glutathionylspermidine synthase
VSTEPIPLRAGDPVDQTTFTAIRQHLVLHSCKWDPQVGDIQTLARFPLIMPAPQWRQISALAEQLADELMTAEAELLRRPDLHRALALPRGIRAVLKHAGHSVPTPAAARVLRFDFHWTDQGWKISEVNSDVPGGYCEASDLPRLMVPHYDGTQVAGDAGAELTAAIAARTLAGLPAGLLVAPGYMEDRQVLSYLYKQLTGRGIECVWISAASLHWLDGFAWTQIGEKQIQLGSIVRFYQAEWLRARRVPQLFVSGKTPVCNPGFAALTESKRLPIVLGFLKCRMPTWSQLLPETRDPRRVNWKHDPGWLVKSALCNTGDTVAIRSLSSVRQWARVKRAVFWQPRNWIAQRRFNAVAIPSPAGDIYPCIGVYTIDGKTAGIYGRFSHRPLIDYTAVDVAVLIETQETQS